MPLPADAVPINQGTNKGGKLPADAVPVSQIGGDNYQELKPINQTNQAEQNPLNVGQSFVSGLPRQAQNKVEAIKRMNIPFVNDVSVGNDNKTMLINGQPFEDMSITNPMSIVKGLSRFVGHNLALVGQMAGLAALPEGGPGSAMLGQAVAGGIGSMVGQYGQDVGSQAVSGEQPSAGGVIGQGAIGAAAPVIGGLLEKGLGLVAGGLRAMQKPTENLVMKLGDHFPEVAETLLGINRGDAQWILDNVKQGRNLKEIFNEPVSKSFVPVNLTNKVFYGTPDEAGNTIGNFIDTYKSHIANASNSENVSLIDSMYRDTHKITPETLGALKAYPTSVFTSPAYTSDNAPLDIANRLGDTLAKAKKDIFQKTYGDAIAGLYEEKANLPLTEELANVIKGLGPISQDNRNGVGALLSDGTLNPQYGTRQERDAIGNFLNLFGVQAKPVATSDLQNILNIAAKQGAKLEVSGKVVGNASDLLVNAADLSASKAYEIMRYAQGPLDTIFKLGGQSSAPIGEFVNAIGRKLSQLSPDLAQADANYAKFKGVQQLLGMAKAGDGISINALKNAYQDPITRSAISELDGILKTHMTAEIQKLGAANEIKAMMGKSVDNPKSFDNAKNIFIRKLRDINNLSNPLRDETRNRLASFDGAINTKFLQTAQDHAAASEFMNKPQSFFKSKYLGNILTGGTLGAVLGGPLGLTSALGVGMVASNPRNIMRALIAGQDFIQGGAVSRGIEGVGKKVSSKAGTALISQLLRKK